MNKTRRHRRGEVKLIKNTTRFGLVGLRIRISRLTRITDKNSTVYIVFDRITVLGLDFVLLISSHKTDWSKHDLELPEGSQTAETIDK